MSAEISLKETWKNPKLVLEGGSKKAPGVCCLRFLGSRETRLGEGGAGGDMLSTAGRRHSVSASVTKAIRLCAAGGCLTGCYY